MQTIRAADLFCGAGGTSSGLRLAAMEAGLELDLLAVNHWNIAIETHSLNHPYARHLCQPIDAVDPRKVVPSGRLNLLVASPECIHHSNARGGRPMNDQSRASAWHILRWLEALYVENVLIENVREFQNWGPLGANGRPLASKRGELYRCFLDSLRSLGYAVEDKILNAADYGDPTTRERLFIIARRRKRITWPEPTHSPQGLGLFGGKTKWRAAREIIDWSIASPSIFARKHPLADKTVARIVAGLRKFGGRKIEPFLVTLYGTGNARSVDRPLPTVTAQGKHLGLCEPFLVQLYGQSGPRSLQEPLPTVTTNGHFGVCEPFIIPQFGGAPARPVSKPLGTVTTTSRGIGLVEPFLVTVNHGDGESRRSHSLSEPLPTLTTKNGLGLVEPLIAKYYGTGVVKPVSEPLDTVTTKDRFGLVTCEQDGARLDIRFRMLQPHELAAAQSLDGYRFAGNKSEVVKQIGNAVPVNLAKALCRELIT